MSGRKLKQICYALCVSSHLLQAWSALKYPTHLDIHFNKRVPAVPIGIIHLVLLVYPADIWTGVIDQTVLVGIAIMPTRSITPIQMLSLFRQMHIAAAQAALCAGKRCKRHTSEASQLRVLVALPISNGSSIPRACTALFKTSLRCSSSLQFCSSRLNARISSGSRLNSS